MMLTIHGLPLGCKYHDLKSLIKQECNLSDFILDNLVGDGDASKKVRIGVADESEGSYLIKCLDGYRMGGNVLRVVPVAKPLMSQAPNNFDQRGGYPPRNDMPNQHNNYGNQSMAPMGGRPSPWAQNTNQWSSNQPTGSQRPTNNFGYQQQTNQPFQQQQQPSPQLRGDPKPFPQRDMRNRMPQDQPGYGFNQKNSAPEPNRRMLRNVDLVPSGGRGDPPRPVQHPLLPSQNQASDRFHGDKPLPINKDYFHGPNQFGNSQQGGPPSHFQSSNQNTPSWGQQMPPQKQPSFGNKPPFEEERKYPSSNKRPDADKPDTNIRNTSAYKSFLNATSGRPVSPHGMRVSPSGRRVSPSGRRISPSGRRISPSGRRISPSGRRISPHAGRVLPDGRRISPHPRPGSPGRMPDRRMSPGRRVSPSGRRMSPGRRISPARRLPGRASPQGGRKMSPHKRFSPSRRLESPPRRDGGRRESPARHGPRFSPNRRPGDKMDKFPDSRAAKQVRPAYEPEASNQAMYSGGYRPNIHENVQYPVAGARQADQRGSWQQDRDKAMFASHMKKQDEERRDARPIVPPRGPEAVVEPKRASPLRKSRSPRRDARDRSPLRDRYRRHSPSPRSPRSPRRSWALEKRRSPEIADAPPPPVWPGQNPDEPFARPSFPEKDDPKKHPTWDRRPFDEPDEALRRDRRPAPEARPFTEPAPAIRIRTDLVSREPMPAARVEPRFKPVGERYSPKLPEPRFEPEQRDYRRPDNGPERKNYPAREEFRDFPRGEDRDNRRRDDFPRREEFPRRDDRKEPFPRRDERPDQRRDHDMFQKEFEDIYKRAKEFKQKVEEMRRPDHNRDDFREDRHRDLERADDRRKMLEDHRREMRDEARQDYRHPDLDRHRQEDRHRLDDRPRSRQSDEFARHRDVDWKDDKPKPVKPMSAESLAKREKAAEEIASKILERHGNFGMSPEVRNRIMVELKNVVTGMINHMFGYKDVSFIETVIKFNAKHNDRDEYKIFQNVMGNFPNLPKTTKRHAEGDSEIPAKTSRRSPENLKQGSRPRKSSYEREKPLQREMTEAERSIRMKPVPRTSVARNDLKPRAPPIKKPLTSSQSAAAIAPHAVANAEGLYEIGPRSYRALKAELEHLMFTMNQVLPESADTADEAEKEVVERWKNDAGDELKKVIGLNVTKRLVNVFNPLNVKVHFTTKPDRKYLSSFLKRYNFVAFKRLAGVVNTFAAQVKGIADFDALCTAKSIHCGAAKITITPFYRFSQCPKKIKTIYNPENKRATTLRSKDSSDNTKDDATNSPKDNVTKEKLTAQPAVNKSAATIPPKVEAKTEAKTTAATSTQSPKPKVENLKPKVQTSSPNVDTKSKVEPAKPKLETPASKPATPQTKVTTTSKTETKVATPQTKVTTAAKTETKVETPKTETPKPNPVTKAQTTPVTEATKPAPAPKVATTPKPTAKVATPAAKVTTPATKVTTPAAKVATPAAKDATPATKVTTPATKVTTPAAKVATPAAKVATPAAKDATPVTKVTTPAAKVTTPGTKVTTPATKVTTPAAKVTTPAAKVAAPVAKVEAPKAKIETPTPKVETPTPKVAPAKPTVAQAKTPVANKAQTSNKDEVPKTNATVAAKTQNTVKATAQTKNTTNVKTLSKSVAKAATPSNTKVAKKVVTPKRPPAKRMTFPNKKATKKAIEKDDFEELDDHDILALISEGIVLDECSGSDVD